MVLGAGSVSWLSARRAAALVGCWRRCRCCQLAKRLVLVSCGGAVSWLCRLRTFLFQSHINVDKAKPFSEASDVVEEWSAEAQGALLRMAVGLDCVRNLFFGLVVEPPWLAS